MAEIVDIGLMMRLLNADEITKEIRKIGNQGVNLGLSKDFLNKVGQVEKELRRATSSAAADLIRKGFDPKLIEQNLGKAQEALRKDMIQAISAGEKVKLESLQKRIKKRFEGVVEATKYESWKEKQLAKEQKRGATDRAAAFMQGVAGAFEQVTAGGQASLKGLASTLQGLGESFKKAGLGKTADEGGEQIGKLNQIMGKFQTKIGSALLKIGLFAGGFLALGAAILGAEAKVKGWNKTLIESGASLRDIAHDAYQAEGALEEIRETAGDVADDWGTMLDEQLKTVGVLSSLGYKYKNLGEKIMGGKTAAEELQESLKLVNMQSQATGMSLEETATTMMDYLNELGGSLKGISDQFTIVQEMSMESGFGVKRFFSMVLQATSGMAMYNVRLQDAAALLTNLTKILGKRVGADFLQSITKGFVDESYQDRYRRILLTGQKKTAKIFQESATRSAGNFLDKLGETFEDKMSPRQISSALSGAFKEAGLELDLDLGGLTKTGLGARERQEQAQKLVQALKGLSPKKQTELLAKMKTRMPPEMVRLFESLLDVSKATNGRIGDMAKGLSGMDIGARFAMQMNRVHRVFTKPLHELNSKQLMAVEHMTGIAGQQLENMRRVSRQLYGSWNEIKAFKDQSKNLTEMTAEERRAFEEKNIEMAKHHGAALDEQGRIVQAQWNEEKGMIEKGNEILETSDQYLASQAKVIEGAVAEKLTKQESWARMTMMSTVSMDQMLRRGVESFLQGIFSFVGEILKILAGGMGTTEKKAQEELINEAKDRNKELEGQRTSLNSQLTSLIEKYDTASAEQRETFRKKIDETKAELRKVETAIRSNQEYLQNLTLLKGKGGLMGFLGADFSKEELRAQAARGALGGMTREFEAPSFAARGELMMMLEKGIPITTEKLEALGAKEFFTDFKPGALERIVKESLEGGKDMVRAIKEQVLAGRRAELAKKIEGLKEQGYQGLELDRKVREEERKLFERQSIKTEQSLKIFRELGPQLRETKLATGESILEAAGISEEALDEIGLQTRRQIDWEQRRADEVDRKETKEWPAAYASAYAKEVEQRMKMEEARALLRNLGFEPKKIDRLATELVNYLEDRGKAPPEVLKALTETKIPMYGKVGEAPQMVPASQYLLQTGQAGAYMNLVKSVAPLKDFILTGRGASPSAVTYAEISPNDTIMGMKAGGPLDRAMGSGQVVNNFYVNGGNPHEIQTVVIEALRKVYGRQHFVGATT